MSNNKTRHFQFKCPVLKGVATLEILEMYFEHEQGAPIHHGTRLTNCDSIHFCGVLKPDGSLDWTICPAHVTLNKGGNL